MKLNALLITSFVILVILLLSARFYFTEVSFSTTNQLWNGISEFSSIYSTNNLYDLSDLKFMGQDTSLLIVGPTINFTVDESSYIKNYMENGGTLIIMDDYGTSNTLLNHLTIPISLDQRPLCQYDSYQISPSFSIIRNFTSAGSQYKVNSLMLNHPVALNVSSDVTVLATTSRQGWIDSDLDGRIWSGEQFDIFPVMASATFGKGTLIIVSDADIITNVMLNRSDNYVFVASLLKGNTIYIDMTHGHEVPPLARLYEIVKYDLAAQVFFTLVLFFAGYLVYRRADILELVRYRLAEEDVYMDKKESIISYMKSKLPLDENELNEMNKKL